MDVVPVDAQIVGQSLQLQCIVTTVRGITSTVDIVWSSGDVMLKTERNVSIKLTTLYFASCTSTYIIPQLSTLDDGRLYSCQIVINTNSPVKDSNSTKLDVIGNLTVCL